MNMLIINEDIKEVQKMLETLLVLFITHLDF